MRVLNIGTKNDIYSAETFETVYFIDVMTSGWLTKLLYWFNAYEKVYPPNDIC